MDSGNSGSMQSSSGGDEEFDSRCSETAPIAAFLNNSSTSNIARVSHQGQKPQTSVVPGFFDNLSARFDAFSRPPPPPPPPQTTSSDPLFNLESMTWMTNTSTPHHCTDVPGSAPSSFVSTGRPGASQRLIPGVPYDPTVGGSSLVTPRGSKKRPRASRRAPTTVLTTDTSNFRQMVQEFTGIPSPPLSSPVFPRSRFDLFNNANVLRQPPGSSSLLRPYAQKHPMTMEDPIFNPFVANINSSTSASPTAAATSSTAPFNPSMTRSTRPTSSSATTPTVVTIGGGDGSCSSGGANQNLTGNYQLPSDPGSLLESNPMFSFQSFLQTSNSPSQNNFTKLPRQSMSGHNHYPSIIHGETNCSASHGFSNISSSSPTADEMTLRGGGVASVGDDFLGWEEEHHGRSIGINGSETTGHDFVTSQDRHDQQFDTDVGKVGW